MVIVILSAAILVTLVTIFVIKSNKVDKPTNTGGGGSTGGDVDIDDESPDQIYK